MKIRELYYRAAKDKHWLDNGISTWTKIFNWGTGPYSHAEIWWPDEGEFKEHAFVDDEYIGECFTSTMRGKDNGTVIRPAREVLKHPERWDYIEREVPDDIAREAIHNARVAARNNQGYDKACIAGFFLPWRIRSKDKDICSEIAQKFLVWIKIFPKYKVWSPRRLSKRSVSKGGVIRPLVKKEKNDGRLHKTRILSNFKP